MFERIRQWFTERGGGKSPLQRNMEKAFELKQDARPQTGAPDHRTSHTGGVGSGQTNYPDSALRAEGTHIENMGPSHGTRDTDKGKTS